MANDKPLEDGYTLALEAYAPGVDARELLVKPETDLDTEFTAWDVAAGEYIRVTGWNLMFDEVEA